MWVHGLRVKIDELAVDDFVEILRVSRLALNDRAPPPLALAAYMVLAGSTGVKALVGDRIVGFAIAEVKDWLGHVLLIAVDPGFQGKGVGSKLMRSLEERMALLGAKVSRLEVLKGDRAVSFYERLGYQKVVVIENYYPYGDAVVMEKDISRLSGASKRSDSRGRGSQQPF